MTSQELQKKQLPDLPGVYIFRDSDGKILYIGKATSLRDRTRSYFTSQVIETRGRLIVDMVGHARDVDFIVTDSVLEALILEASLIKKHQPYYNTKEKDNKSFNFVIFTKEDFPQILTIRGRTLEAVFPKDKIKYAFGPFPHGPQLSIALKIIRRIFPYRDQKCTPNAVRPCFNRQIGLCPGVCSGEISRQEYAKIINHLRLFFEGKKSELIKSLEREMKTYSKQREFEKANDTKKTLFALNHIQDVSLIKKEKKSEIDTDTRTHTDTQTQNKPFRIEAYDVAHLSGTSQVGVMVVLEDGEPSKPHYRKFKIQTLKKESDVDSLAEILRRRLKHTEWPAPDLITLDGGQTQVSAAEKILASLNISIPIISVVKDDRHKPRDIIGDEAIIKKATKEAILLANSEAHRFAITYHRHLRGRLR